jgi:pilus assembly protein CpaF
MEPIPDAAHVDALASTLRAQLLEEALAGPDDAATGPLAAGRAIAAAVDREAGVLDAATRAAVSARIAEQALGLGPIEGLLSDPGVDEILVAGTGPIWVERAGRLEPTELAFASEDELRETIERLLARAGRRADESEPLCDARMPDGSRVNVVLPPLAIDGPALTIRRFRPAGLTAAELVALGTWTPALHRLLEAAVRGRLNLLVCGGTGSGKTTTLGALGGAIGEHERVVTIEDTAELRLPLAHVVRLETRPPSVDGRGEVTIRELVRNALRMRPDRIVVGEVRGAEAHDMLAALATGHDGSLSTVHAGSPAEALRRVETLALMAGLGLPHEAIRAQVADALDLVVHQARRPGGARVVTEVCEVVRVAGGAGVRTIYALRGARPVLRAPCGERVRRALAGETT